MRVPRRAFWGFAMAPWLMTGLWLFGCAAPQVPGSPTPANGSPNAPLTDPPLWTPAGENHQVGALLTRAPWSVFVFFSKDCPTVEAHDKRLIEVWRDYQTRGVSFFLVASEEDVTPAGLEAEHTRRGYPFPLVWDRGGGFARALGVRYASQVFVLDAQGAVAYAGSIDSDRRFLHADAQPFLRAALDALLAGSPAPLADSRAYGCALRF